MSGPEEKNVTAGATWSLLSASEANIDEARLAALIEFAQANETRMNWGADVWPAKSQFLRERLGPEADVEMVGPFTTMGRLNGLIIRHGCVVADFGDTGYVDEIASATKSFLSSLAGVALDRGLIGSVDETVFSQTRLDLLDTPHNRRITWHHLLQQTSEWEGELFGKVPTGHSGTRIGERLRRPGDYFEYNDVRVNLLPRSLLEVFRRPLPEVLRETIMRPICASDTWQWHGYSNSTVDVDGSPMESVSGGAHWGGGIWMNSSDFARFGQLYLNEGSWCNRRVLPCDWVKRTRVSCPKNFMYGYMWWLQHDALDRQVSFAAQGGGSHACFVIPDHDLVVVIRWIRDEAWQSFLNQALRLVTDHPPLGPIKVDFSRVNRAVV